MNKTLVAGLALAALLLLAAPAQAGSGSLTTLFASNNNAYGNMFDITPAVDLSLTAIDLNASNYSQTVSFDLWYRVGTSVGFESNPAGWIFLGNYSSLSNGEMLPTHYSLAGNGMTFLAGQTYGIYVNLTSSSFHRLQTTNGPPTAYANADLSLLTNCTKGPGFGGQTFFDRRWNGTLYYDTPGGGVPFYTVTDLKAGWAPTFTITNATPGGVVLMAVSVTGAGPIGTSYGPLDLSPPVFIVATLIADGTGDIALTAWADSSFVGVTLYTQCADVGSHALTNSIARTFL